MTLYPYIEPRDEEPDTFTVDCDECGGDGGFDCPTHWEATGGWQECRRCKGAGEIELENKSMTDDEAEAWGAWAESIIDQIGEEPRA